MRYTPTDEQQAYLKRIGVPEFGGALPNAVLRPVPRYDPSDRSVRPRPARRMARTPPTPPSTYRDPAPINPWAKLAARLGRWFNEVL